MRIRIHGWVLFLAAVLSVARAAEPVLRTKAEVDAVLKDAPTPDEGKLRTLNILLAAGVKDHGPNEHDYPQWQIKWKDLLAKAKNVKLETAFGWPKKEQFDAADVIIFYARNIYDETQLKDVDAFIARGGGVVIVHTALCPKDNHEGLAARVGMAWQNGKTKYRHGPLDLKITAAESDPITRGMHEIHFVDETYWNFFGDSKTVEVLATAEEEKQAQPIIWTWKKEKGRVFSCVLGHFIWTFDDPFFRLLILRGAAWSAGEKDADINRFDSLATDAVKYKE